MCFRQEHHCEVGPVETLPTMSVTMPSSVHLSNEDYGNYRNYYFKRRDALLFPQSRDERLPALPRSYFEGKKVLDVGCNSGQVTVELAQRYHPKLITGVDLDPALIAACQRTLRQAWSHQSPVTEDKSASIDPDYFPAALPKLHGNIFIPPAQTSSTFPYNVEFKAVNWATDEIVNDKDGYDTIILFALTKWIHLHQLDEGIKAFFHKCFKALKPGGHLIIERQPWSKYKEVNKKGSALSENYKKLQLRPSDDFERILTEEVGFIEKVRLNDQEENVSHIHRELDVYAKSKDS